MTTLINTNVQNNTITSLDLLNEFINPAREAAGEPNLRNTELLRKIDEEFEGEQGVMQKICTTTSQGAKRNVKGYTLTHDQAMIIAMRESKAVRRSVVKQLQELQQRVNVAETAIDAIATSETHEEALSIAHIAQEQRRMLRVGHKEDSKRISKAVAEGTLSAGGHEHNFIHTRVSMFLFGCAPCVFSRKTGMDVRDYFESIGDIESLAKIAKVLENIVTLSEVGFTKDQLMQKFPTNPEKYFK